VELAMKAPCRDSTVVPRFAADQRVAGSAALVRDLRRRLIRHHGMLAPSARGRTEIVPEALLVAGNVPKVGASETN
jgi:hypothetical protein